MIYVGVCTYMCARVSKKYSPPQCQIVEPVAVEVGHPGKYTHMHTRVGTHARSVVRQTQGA
jgi:hypothetical protein